MKINKINTMLHTDYDEINVILAFLPRLMDVYYFKSLKQTRPNPSIMHTIIEPSTVSRSRNYIC